MRTYTENFQEIFSLLNAVSEKPTKEVRRWQIHAAHV